MYPKVSDFFNDLFGTNWNLPIQTYGFFVAMAFLAAGSIIMLELKRKEKEGLLKSSVKKVLIGKPASMLELIMSGIFGFIIGLKLGGILLNYSHFASNPQEFILSSQGNFIGGLIMAAVFVYFRYREKNKAKLEKPIWEEVTIHPSQLAGNIVLIAAIAGLIGAKIFHNLENLDKLIKDPVGEIFSFSGLTYFGGLICGSAAVIYYAYKNNIHWRYLIDAAAPAIILAYGIGRLGCQCSGDGCWGEVNEAPKPEWLAFLPDWLWAFDYPHNVIDDGIPIDSCTVEHCNVLEKAVFPTPIYETTICTFLFGVLWFLRKRIHIPGILFSLFLIMNGIERFFIEKIRVNNKFDLLGIRVTQAEVISTVLVIIGLIGIWFFIKMYRKEKEEKSEEK